MTKYSRPSIPPSADRLACTYLPPRVPYSVVLRCCLRITVSVEVPHHEFNEREEHGEVAEIQTPLPLLDQFVRIPFPRQSYIMIKKRKELPDT